MPPRCKWGPDSTAALVLFLVENGWTSLHVSESYEEFRTGALAKTSFWLKASEEVNDRDAKCHSTAQSCINKTRALQKVYSSTTQGFHKLVEEIRQQQGAPPAPRGQDVLLTARQEKQVEARIEAETRDLRLQLDAAKQGERNAKQGERNAKRRLKEFKRKIVQIVESEPWVDPANPLRQKMLKMCDCDTGESANSSDVADRADPRDEMDAAASKLSEEQNMADEARDLLMSLSPEVRDQVLDEIFGSIKDGKYKNVKTIVEGELAIKELTGRKDLLTGLASVAIDNPSFVGNNLFLIGQMEAYAQLASLNSTKGMRWDQTRPM